MYNHEAIYRAYPNARGVWDDKGVFDANGNQIILDQALVDAAAVIVAKEQAIEQVRRKRAAAYTAEADPLFFKYQADEVTKEEWLTKREEIRQRYPYPNKTQ